MISGAFLPVRLAFFKINPQTHGFYKERISFSHFKQAKFIKYCEKMFANFVKSIDF
jgi:hypothetical protein